MPSPQPHDHACSGHGLRNEQGRRLSDRPTPPAVQRYLGGIDYPCSKQDLIETADEHDAPQDVIDALEAIAPGRFDGPVDVSKALAATHD